MGVKGTKECCLIGIEFPETDAGADSTTVEFHSVPTRQLTQNRSY